VRDDATLTINASDGATEREAAEGGHPHVAVSLNGRIETIVPAPFDRRKGRIVAALLPEPSLKPDGNELALYLVRDESAGGANELPRLAPLHLK
jgi:hypothetical protein